VSDVAAGHHSFSCDSITYEVEIPTACASGGCGVVVDVHGATMTATNEDKSSGLRAAGGALGYVVVQPTAPLVIGYHSWTPATDDPKVWTFVQQVVTALAINPKKLHFTGFSQGGAMTWRMLCAHADVLASVAPVAAADGQSLTSTTAPFVLDCSFTGSNLPSQQLPILQMHGTADGLVPFAKGQQQRDAVIAAWSLGSPSPVASDAKYAHTRYLSPTGTVVEFLQHDYVAPSSLLLVNLGGHCLPGGQDLPPGGTPSLTLYFSCAQPNGFVWGEKVMQFFVAHPRP
jgi:polyhydroxybutyrate depolymerase